MFIEAIRRNLSTKDATDSEIQKAIVAFLPQLKEKKELKESPFRKPVQQKVVVI